MSEDNSPDAAPVSSEQGWRCPFTNRCTKFKLHRRCTSDICKGAHCWDCCARAGMGCQTECPEPSMDSIDYDLPDGERLT